jgi:hypothetical protein
VTTAVPSPSAAQARASLAGVSRAASHRTACLDEVRDALTHAGHGRAQVDDWPDVMPALTDLIAERDRLRQQLDSSHEADRRMLDSNKTLAAERYEWQERALAAEKQLAARVEPGTVDCPRCPARAGRRCKSPSGQIVNWHSERTIAAQQAGAGVGQ